jgi:hypothetical protein
LSILYFLLLRLCFTLTELSIVAVHGLNPINVESYAYTTWTSDDKLWLRDFLPKVLPRARMLIFGYNANATVDSSIAGVREQAGIYSIGWRLITQRSSKICLN